MTTKIPGLVLDKKPKKVINNARFGAGVLNEADNPALGDEPLDQPIPRDKPIIQPIPKDKPTYQPTQRVLVSLCEPW